MHSVAVDEDEALAYRYPVPLLISGRARHEIETIARRVHMTQCGLGAPFVTVNAGMFPSHPRRLQRCLAESFEPATIGSMFITDVEEMPIRAQDAFVKVLIEGCHPAPLAVRLIAGTTVSLFERIAAGHFAEELFYRLNVIHLVVTSARAAPLGGAV